MKTTKVKLFSIVLASVILLTLQATLLAADEVVLKMAIIVPEKSIWGQQFKASADEIREKNERQSESEDLLRWRPRRRT
jgi:TRAP-type C4-dicarboxylate transport system substrate-binding protein